MSNNYTITLSLGSGPKGEALARQIKAWAAGRPISEAIRDLIKAQLQPNSQVTQKTQSLPPQ